MTNTEQKHTPGPLTVLDDYALWPSKQVHAEPRGIVITSSISTVCDVAYIDGDKPDLQKLHLANARLLAASYNAFDSAAARLGLNAVELAERMQDGGIADLVLALRYAHGVLEANGLDTTRCWIPLDKAEGRA